MAEPLAGLAAVGCLVLATAACDGGGERSSDVMSRAGGGESLPAWSAVADARVAGEWRNVGADEAGSRYSPLMQINASNVADLEPAWTVALARPAPGTDAAVAVRSTPLVAGGLMYLTSGDQVIALDAATGREVWRGWTRLDFSARGMAYWAGDGTVEPRLYVAAADRLLALNARNGRPAAGFGRRGQILSAIADGTAPLIIGARVFVATATAGVRAYALHDGQALWRFDVPHPRADQLRVSGMIAEQDRGIIHVSLSAQASAGALTPATDMPPSSMMALDAPQGRLLWQYDVVRADVWGHGIVSAPLLYEAGRGASRVPGLALLSGAGLVHLLQRASGDPLMAVTERLQSTLPDVLPPVSQPIPQTAALHRSLHQLSDVLVTAEATNVTHTAACAALLRDASQVTGVDPFSPVTAAAGSDAPAAFVRLPATRFKAAGAMALDPALGYLFINVSHVGEITYVAADTSPGRDRPDQAAVPFIAQPNPPTPQGAWPCQPPPWGELVAVNTVDGGIAWRVPLGVTDGLPSERRDTGRPGRGGPLATASGLVFIGSTDDRMLRAFSSATGEELWSVGLPMNAYSMPFTYTAGDGRQYLAVIASGEPILDSRVWMPVVTPRLLTFALRDR